MCPLLFFGLLPIALAALRDWRELIQLLDGDFFFDGKWMDVGEHTLKETALAAQMLDPKYVDCIIQRWQDFCGCQATLEADGRTFEQVKGEPRIPTDSDINARAREVMV